MNGSPELVALVPYVFPLLERGDEALMLGLKLLEAYVLLAGAAVLQQHGPALATAFAALPSVLRSEGMVLLCKVRREREREREKKENVETKKRSNTRTAT